MNDYSVAGHWLLVSSKGIGRGIALLLAEKAPRSSQLQERSVNAEEALGPRAGARRHVAIIKANLGT